MNLTPIRLIASGMVAEKSKVWRSLAHVKWSTQYLPKPMLSISSACSLRLRFHPIRLAPCIWSNLKRRPGVPWRYEHLIWGPYLLFDVEPLQTERTSHSCCGQNGKFFLTLHSQFTGWSDSRTHGLSVSIFSKVGKPAAVFLSLSGPDHDPWPAIASGIVCSE